MGRVSILIFSSFSESLKDIVQSCVEQTQKPHQVIICSNKKYHTKDHKIASQLKEEYSFIKFIESKETYKNPKADGFKDLIKFATGDYIQLLPDNIIIHPEFTETLSQILDKDPEVKLATGRIIFADKKSNIIINQTFWRTFYSAFQSLFTDKIIDGKEFIKAYLRMTKNLPPVSPLFRKTSLNFELFKSRDFEFKVETERFLWLYLLKDGGKVFLSRKNLYTYKVNVSAPVEIDAQVESAIERYNLISDEFLTEVGIKLSKEESRELTENLFIEMTNLIRECERVGRKDLAERLSRYTQELVRKKQKDSSYLVYNNIKRRREPFSIIIVTRNNESTILQCIQSILNNIRNEDEVIVVDNGSNDKTPQILKDIANKSKNVRIFFNGKDSGYSQSINLGVKKSKNEFLVFINPDTVITTPDWLEIFYRSLEKDNVGAVGPVSEQGMWKNNVAHYTKIPQEIIPIWLRSFYDGEEIGTKILSDFCIATKKTIFEKLGGFDESITSYLCIIDFCLRLQEEGLEMKVLPSVFIRHMQGNTKSKPDTNSDQISTLNFAKKLLRKYGYGNVPTPEKWFGMDSPSYYPYELIKLVKFKFLFNFSGTYKDKNFFVSRAKIINKKPPISVVTVNWKSFENIKELAKSIIDSNYPNINLIVVDNSEDEEEYEKLRSFESIFNSQSNEKKMFILENENNGFASGCNKGIRFAKEELKSEFIWLLNPDTVIQSDTPLELLRTMLYTDVPVVTCKMKIYGGDLVQYNGIVVSEASLEDREVGILYIQKLSGANIFLRADVFDRVGYLSENFFLYFEDDEFFDRLKAKGIFPVYTPYTFIYHKIKEGHGLLGSSLHLYYFVKNLLFFFHQKDKEALFYILDKISDYYIYAFNQGLEKSAKAIILGIYDFIQQKRGKQDISEIEKNKEEWLLELSKIDLGKPGERMPVIDFMNLLKINLMANPYNPQMFERYIQGLSLLLFEEISGKDIYMLI